MKKQLATAALALTATFAPLAATSTGNDPAPEGDKTEIVNDNNLTAPVVVEGTSVGAMRASRGDKMTMYVSEGLNSDRTGEEIAKILANGFANRDFTDKPMYITVFHGTSEGHDGVGIKIFMDGVRFGIQHEDRYVSVFTPRQVGGAVDNIAEEFVRKHGDHNVIPPTQQPVILALN